MTHNKKSKFGSIVLQLMETRGLKGAQLGKILGMPRASIQRIITGTTENPSAHTLLALSSFFNVTVDYLLGVSNEESPPFIPPAYYNEPTSRIPVLKWNQVKSWLYTREDLNLDDLKSIPVEDINANSFAVIIDKHALSSIFPMNSVVIIDPTAEYKYNDYVLVSINKNTPTIRQLGEENGDIYLHPVNVIIPSIRLEPPHAILGTVLECRFNMNR